MKKPKRRKPRKRPKADPGATLHRFHDAESPDAQLWWLLTFTDRGAALGSSIVDALDRQGALDRAIEMGCTPRVAAECTPYPVSPAEALQLQAGDKHRLLTPEEAAALGARLNAGALTTAQIKHKHYAPAQPGRELWWWLSFVDEGVFQSAAIVDGPDLGAAIARATEMGCNPGGKVLAVHLVPGAPALEVGDKHRLLTLLESDAFNDRMPPPDGNGT